ncbi:hypothetical protein B9Z55_004102 [Caenorhabditis nigoni]|uniref:Uncharacterized protein n=1 Tax=Caenorhabditis nigoni TaxID=1611254 RepID=A0A2G5UUU7_9PELO|nr:hypothetical protein B9Z55_004102 [Caenorhabditis nigoni]
MLSINSHITVDSSNVFLFPRLPSRFDHPSRAEYPFEICKINVNINWQILICFEIICYLLVCYFSSSAIAGSSAILARLL